MSELIKCAKCKGAKKIMGLGMIVADCKECNGVGYKNEAKVDNKAETVKEESIKPLTSLTDSLTAFASGEDSDINKPKKQRGRPKKNT